MKKKLLVFTCFITVNVYGLYLESLEHFLIWVKVKLTS